MSTKTKQSFLAKITGRSTAAALAREAVTTRKPVRTGHYTGSGRWTSATDNTEAVKRILGELGIRVVTGNDAPRGGVTGNWLRVATRAEAMAQRGRELNGEAWREADLILRAHQVERHLTLPPASFRTDSGDIMPHAPIFGTERADDYHGCGPITVYLNAAGQMVAFHYGYTMPHGWAVPEGLTTRRGTASCGEACWF